MSNPLASSILQESKTLWIGDVESWMDESYIANLFANTGHVQSVKVIRDKTTGLPAGYGFVEFTNHEVASQVLQAYNGTPIQGTTKTFRLNWGIYSGGGTKVPSIPLQQNIQQSYQQQPMQRLPMSSQIADYSIYVGDIDPMLTDLGLMEFFQQRYKSVIGAKVIIDPITKYGKGYGFVKFTSYEESIRAISEMQGALLKGRHIKTSQAFWKGTQQDISSYSMPVQSYGVASNSYQTQNYMNMYPYLQQQQNPYGQQISYIQQQNNQPSYINQTYLNNQYQQQYEQSQQQNLFQPSIPQNQYSLHNQPIQQNNLLQQIQPQQKILLHDQALQFQTANQYDQTQQNIQQQSNFQQQDNFQSQYQSNWIYNPSQGQYVQQSQVEQNTQQSMLNIENNQNLSKDLNKLEQNNNGIQINNQQKINQSDTNHQQKDKNLEFVELQSSYINQKQYVDCISSELI